MVSRKRGRDEQDVDEGPTPAPKLLQQIRNAWEFASLMQYIFFFGKAVKIDEDLDVDTLEIECTRASHSKTLPEIGLALLKFVSSHKGLTPEIFDEYTRRQFVAKAAQRNPFGTDELPRPFAEMDIFTKLRVLHQLSVWTLNNPDRIRERMPEKDTEQTIWRIEPLGWDSQARSYFLLDDDRLYRRTEPSPVLVTSAKSHTKSMKGQGKHANKRRKLLESQLDESEAEGESFGRPDTIEGDNGLGGANWECIAITLQEYKSFLETIRRSRDVDEKVLLKRITMDALPVIEKRAEAQERKAAQKRRQLENVQKLSTAKRSSRIAGKMDKEREIREAEEAVRKRKEDLAMAHKEEAKKHQMEADRESRMMTREQRLKEREVKRILHEEELARLEKEDSQTTNSNAGEGRVSERQRKVEMEKRQRELEKLNQAGDDWDFNCSICGVHGKNLDDGTHSLACEKCNVWQHSACHGIKETDAEREDFHFLCSACSRPKVNSIKIRLNSSASPKTERTANKVVSSSSATDTHPHTNGVLHAQRAHPNSHHTELPQIPSVMVPAPPRVSATQRPSQYPPMGMFNIPPTYGQSVPPVQADPYLSRSQGKFQYLNISNGMSVPRPIAPSSPACAQSPPAQQSISAQSPWPNGQPSPSPAYTPLVSTPHNPFLNHFSRQRPGSAQSNQSLTSPTPSLSATQGNTDVRFSMMQNAGDSSSNAYIPVVNQPAAGAFSPTKNAPSPAQPFDSLPHLQVTPAAGSLHVPAVAAGLSPAKHAGSHTDSAHGLGITTSGPSTLTLPPILTRPCPLVTALPPGLSLSPSVNTGEQNLEPPRKKAMPEGQAASHMNGYKASSVY